MKLHPNWKASKQGGAVVSDEPTPDQVNGANDVEHYGGYLVAESVPPSLVPFIAAAPAVVYLLEMIRDAHCDAKADGVPVELPEFVRARMDHELGKMGRKLRPVEPAAAREVAYFGHLLQLLDAVDALEKSYDFSKLVYDVRDNEMEGWTGPRVTAAGAAVATITNVLKAVGRR